MNCVIMILLLFFLIVVGVLLMVLLYIVDVWEKVLVMCFGEVVEVCEDFGIGFKVLFIDNVVCYDVWIFGILILLMEVMLLDDCCLVVDVFVCWQIIDVVQFCCVIVVGGV